MTTPNLSHHDIERVRFALASGGWLKGREISKRFGIPGRLIRAVAEQTGEIISGQRGYRLVKFASAEEIRECIADLRSRAWHLEQRAAKYERHLLPSGHKVSRKVRPVLSFQGEDLPLW